MSIKKQFLRTKPVCRVTFRLPAEAAGGARRAAVVGEFNDWDTSATPMKRLKSGDYKAIVDLPVEQGFQFRYLVDSQHWVNEDNADADAATPFPDARNSIVKT